MAGQNQAEKHLDSTAVVTQPPALTHDKVQVSLGDVRQVNAAAAANSPGDNLHDVSIGTGPAQAVGKETYNKADDSTHSIDSDGTELVGYGPRHGPGVTQKYDHGYDKGYTRDKFGNERHWGPTKADTYNVNVEKGTDGSVTKTMSSGEEPYGMISRDTVNRDGSEKHEYANKTGYTKDKYGNEHHWGPKSTDNYEARTEADGTRIKTFKDGSREYDYKNGGKMFQNEDKSKGFTLDTNGVEKHWGPNGSDNYSQKTEGGKTFRTGYKDGHMETDLADGNTQIYTPAPG